MFIYFTNLVTHIVKKLHTSPKKAYGNQFDVNKSIHHQNMRFTRNRDLQTASPVFLTHRNRQDTEISEMPTKNSKTRTKMEDLKIKRRNNRDAYNNYKVTDRRMAEALNYAKRSMNHKEHTESKFVDS